MAAAYFRIGKCLLTEKAANKFSLELLFSSLADRTRLRLLNLMNDDEVCVCFFVEVLQLNQPKISRHLAFLRRAGIVEARREGPWMHYRVVEPENEDGARILRRSSFWIFRKYDTAGEFNFASPFSALP
ncbi:MAG TPA: metalloregulator ArsR/SmtB family transcription factor [Pyrinomonadaceae bacterium]|nr:metalloregulator ArsR/SmtB family transcription factor [Pyrinomonadaceae bacterium]